MKYLVVAPANSGTGYIAAVLNACGIACGHEAVFGPTQALDGRQLDWGDLTADVSWMAAPLLPYLTGPVAVIHQTRDVGATIDSLVRSGLFTKVRDDGPFAPYQRVIQWAAPEVFATPSPTLRATRFVVAWDAMIRPYAVAWWKVETVAADMIAEVFDIPQQRAERALAETPKNTNSRRRR